MAQGQGLADSLQALFRGLWQHSQIGSIMPWEDDLDGSAESGVRPDAGI